MKKWNLQKTMFKSENCKFLILKICLVSVFAGLLFPSIVFAEKIQPPVIPCNPNSAAPCISEDTQKKDGGKGIRDYVANTIGGNVISGFLGTIAIAAVIFIIVGGVQMILAFGNEEAVGKAKKTLIWAFIGLAIAILSVAMVRIISNLDFKP